ncbi:MAG: polysaccharide biosynthesis tyrosine autokinase [Chloroflexaceae bacterium]|nr:polysaccharide biosynthesis tyrosine autokinase [Chloroflexaceae bacterium]
MDIRIYIDILWRRKLIVITPVIVAVLLTAFITLQITPLYRASATLRVPTSAGSTVDYGEYVYISRLLNTLAQYVRTRSTIEEVRQRVGAPEAAELTVEVEFPANTELMRIVVISPSPNLATVVANELLDFTVNRARLERRRAEIVSAATVPESPFSPRLPLNVALAGIVGLMAGVGLAFLVENFDRTLYTTRHIRQVANLPLLGKIPPVPRKQRYIWQSGTSAHSEAFRRLRTRLMSMNGTRPLSIVLFTSAQPGEGKSTTVANLAYVLARAGQSVIVVDSDLRLPTIHRIFNLPNDCGLSNVLCEEVGPLEAIQETPFPGLRVVTSGSADVDPDQLLHTKRLRTLLEMYAQHAKMVLVDAPAFIAVTDTAMLVPHIDAVVLVINRSHAQRELVKSTCEQLAGLNATVVGMVINRAEGENVNEYIKYYQSK